MPTDVTISGTLYRNTSGKLDSAYAPMPQEYRLSLGRYSAAKFPMEIVYPRPDSETSPYSYHRIWQTGEPYSIPIRAMWGAFPHAYKIIAAPDGWTIGNWLVADEHNRLVPNDEYGTLYNASPTAGVHAIIVGIWDASGAFTTATFAVNVGDHGLYAAAEETGDGSGSDPENCMALTDAHTAGTGDSPAKHKILFIRGGDYEWEGNFIINANKSIAIVGYRDEMPRIISQTPDAQVQMNSSDIFITGVDFSEFGDKSTLITIDYVHRQTVWRCKFTDAYGNPSVSDNEACWAVMSTNNETKRQYFLLSECTFHDCHEVCAFDWYSVKGIIERCEWFTMKATMEEPIYFPKASCEYDMRWLRFDNEEITSADNNQGILMPYNSDVYSQSRGHLRFNFVRCGSGVTAVIWNGAQNILPNSPREGHDDRNTYIGGKVFARDHGGDLIVFTNDVMQNVNSGVVPTSTGYEIYGDDSIGTSGIVDESGMLINTARRGLDGADIYGD